MKKAVVGGMLLPPAGGMILHAGHAVNAWSHWGGDPSSAVTLIAGGALYAAGARRVWRSSAVGHGVRLVHAGLFAAGMLALFIALISPLDALAADLFSAHMAQHILLAVLAPPLLVAGAPHVATMWVLPADTRRSVAAFVKRQRWLMGAWHAATQPFIACGIHAVALWAWHAPTLFLTALANPFVHFLEHASFVGTGALLWWSILRPRRARDAGYAIGIVALFFTLMQSGALGALLALSAHVWYPAQALGARAWGMTPLEDQQLAGLVMWVPGTALYVVAMGFLFVAWMRRSGRDRGPGRELRLDGLLIAHDD